MPLKEERLQTLPHGHSFKKNPPSPPSEIPNLYSPKLPQYLLFQLPMVDHLDSNWHSLNIHSGHTIQNIVTYL